MMACPCVSLRVCRHPFTPSLGPRDFDGFRGSPTTTLGWLMLVYIGDLMVINPDLMVINGDLMEFNGDSMTLNGFNGVRSLNHIATRLILYS